MQLVTFEAQMRRGAAVGAPPGREPPEPARAGARRLGALLPDRVLDLNRAFALRLALDDVGAPEAQAESLLPPDLVRFLARGAPARAAAESTLAFARESLGRYDAPDLARAGVLLPLRSVRLCAPIPRPGKLVAVAPARSSDGEPVLLPRANTCVAGPEDDVLLPADARSVEAEESLAVVLGQRARRLGVERALACVAGYSAAWMLTAQDWRDERGQVALAGCFDGFAPLGPALVTADEVPDPDALGVATRRNGEPLRSWRAKDLPFGVARLVAFASSVMTLEPGDVLLTGAPPIGTPAAGAGPRPLREGDVLELDVERVGRLRSHVRRESARP